MSIIRRNIASLNKELMFNLDHATRTLNQVSMLENHIDELIKRKTNNAYHEVFTFHERVAPDMIKHHLFNRIITIISEYNLQSPDIFMNMYNRLMGLKARFVSELRGLIQIIQAVIDRSKQQYTLVLDELSHVPGNQKNTIQELMRAYQTVLAKLDTADVICAKFQINAFMVSVEASLTKSLANRTRKEEAQEFKHEAKKLKQKASTSAQVDVAMNTANNAQSTELVVSENNVKRTYVLSVDTVKLIMSFLPFDAACNMRSTNKVYYDLFRAVSQEYWSKMPFHVENNNSIGKLYMVLKYFPTTTKETSLQLDHILIDFASELNRIKKQCKTNGHIKRHQHTNKTSTFNKLVQHVPADLKIPFVYNVQSIDHYYALVNYIGVQNLVSRDLVLGSTIRTSGLNDALPNNTRIFVSNNKCLSLILSIAESYQDIPLEVHVLGNYIKDYTPTQNLTIYNYITNETKKNTAVNTRIVHKSVKDQEALYKAVVNNKWRSITKQK